MRLTVANARIVVVHRVLERLTLEQKKQLVDWVWILLIRFTIQCNLYGKLLILESVCTDLMDFFFF
jgi:hypothetical protein